MATGKNIINVYRDWITIFEKLSNEESGILIKHFFNYVNDLEIDPPDRLTELLFEPIKLTLKRDLKKWEEEVKKQSVSGRMGNLKRYNTDLYNSVLLKSISLERAEEIALTRKLSPPDKSVSPPDKNTPDLTKNVADKDKDKDKDINTINNTFPEKPEKIEKTDFIDQVINLFSEQFLKYRQVEYFISNKKIERSMAGKLLKAYKQNTKNTGKTSEQTLIELSEFFEKCMLITDPWLNQNMSLPIVINKLNQIINILRNGNKQPGVKQGVTEHELAEIIADKFGSDSENRG